MKIVYKLLLACVATLAAIGVHAADANVTGSWAMTVETERGARESAMTLTQTGDKVTGTIKGQRGENPVSGTIKGNALDLSYKIAAQGNEMEIKYTGTVEGNTINGTVSMGPLGNGKFTAKKQ
jgi:hypothetical protein